MIRVHRIAHATFETPDLDRQVTYYTEILGLSLVAKEKDAAYLNALNQPAITLRRGANAACKRIAFQVAPDDDLGDFDRQVAGHGIKTTRKKDPEPGIPEVVSFEDPKGTLLEVFREQRGTQNEARPHHAIAPFKLGHVAFNVTGVHKVTDFYCDVLGFRVSDWFADFFSFLRCGPDHHTINLLDGEKVRLNHMAFELRDWSHIQSACDFLGKNGYPLIWGPGRHGPGHNLFAYHRNPDGHIVELFAELDRMNDEALGYFEPRPWHLDFPQKPKTWPKDLKFANLWGIPPPPEMMA